MRCRAPVPAVFRTELGRVRRLITDFEWLPARGYLLAFADADRLLADDPNQLQTLVEVLRSASAIWSIRNRWRPRTAFHVLFHCNADHYSEVEARLSAAGAELEQRELVATPDPSRHR